ncbi:hypothetical protein CDAR_608581 [Caerostris darwini]|uniref:Uncharacterized protein n=1 Tax=Caerostris darwini TaxID=1538125 RepID=A0AAV4WIS4_9ARAC|nr:hypothetical protein CDAR_608581 [Caerostris darwini]
MFLSSPPQRDEPPPPPSLFPRLHLSLAPVASNKGRGAASGAGSAPLASTERRRDSILISDPGFSRAENDFKGQPLSPQWQPIGKVISKYPFH